MSPETEKIDLINAYLSKRLKSDEARQFERQLKTDASLRADYQEYNFIQQGFKGLALEKFQSHLNTLENTYSQATQTVSLGTPSGHRIGAEFSWRRYAAAAAIFLLIPSMLYFLASNKAEEHHLALFEKYNTPLQPTIGRVRDAAESDLKNNLNEGIIAYSNKAYLDALDCFEKYLSQPNTPLAWHEEAMFYKAASLFGLKKHTEAEQLLTALATHKEFRHREECDWLLALNALNSNDLSLTKTRLTAIVNTANHDFIKEAKSLLEEF